jgi:hypothetical protein
MEIRNSIASKNRARRGVYSILFLAAIACISLWSFGPSLMLFAQSGAIPSDSRPAIHSTGLPTPNSPAPSTTANPRTQDLTTGKDRTSEVTVVTTDPNQLVLAAVRQAVWGPSVSCKIQQTSKAYGQQAVLIGDFKSEGVGPERFRRFRYSVRIAVGETGLDFLQVSDGRMMWTQVGNESPLRRVILDQVFQSVPNAFQFADSRPDVNMIMAIGGQAELLRALYHRYNWYKAAGGKLGGNDVWQLVGRLRTEPAKFVGNTLLDEQNSILNDPASKIPTEARLTLSRSAKLPYFPYIVEYFDRARNRDGEPSGFELITRIEYSEPNTNVTFTQQDFLYRVSDNTDEIKDETQMYVPRAPLPGLGLFPTN